MHQITRREFMATSSAMTVGSLMAHGQTPVKKRPLKLLFLMTDQHRFDVLGCMGNPLVKTPNLDRLSEQGVFFTQACSTVPYCSPTRAAIVTGRYPSTLGIFRNVKGNVDGKPDPIRLREPVQTYVHRLVEKGYACHQLGKWHLGREQELSCYPDGDKDVLRTKQEIHRRRKADGEKAIDPIRPEETRNKDIYMTPNTHRCHMIWKDDKRRTQQDLSIIGRSRVKPEYQYESVLADTCIELLRKHKDQPFAITYSVSPPHALWVAPAPFYDMYSPGDFTPPANASTCPEYWQRTQAYRLAQLFGPEGMGEYLRCYYAQVSMMDWCFGRILDELNRLGLAGNTLVIFTSDHGDMNGGHGLMDKTVNNFYEEIVRVPLIMRCPGLIPAGVQTEVLTTSVDLAPTILDILEAPSLDKGHGRSLKPFLTGQKADPQPAFFERGNPNAGKGCCRGVRTTEWKLTIAATGRHELYDLKSDPGETRNLYGKSEYADTQKSLLDQLRHHMTKIDDPALNGTLKAAMPPA